MVERMKNEIRLIFEKAAQRGMTNKSEVFDRCRLITPACGLGPTSLQMADRVFEVLSEMGEILKRGQINKQGEMKWQSNIDVWVGMEC